MEFQPIGTFEQFLYAGTHIEDAIREGRMQRESQGSQYRRNDRPKYYAPNKNILTP